MYLSLIGQGGRHINTPIDDPTQFSPSWRAEIAQILATDGRIRLPKTYAKYSKDEYIKAYTKHLKDASKTSDPRHIIITPYTQATRWYAQESLTDTKFKLEPLLLTTASFSTIAEALSGGALDVETIRVYERLFFNIRDDEGDLNRSCHLRTWFALPNEESVLDPSDLSPAELWRFIGTHGGYQALCRLWLWKDAPGFDSSDAKHLSTEAWWLSQSTMMGRLVRTNISNKDLVSYMERYIDGERLKLEERTEEGNTKLEMAYLELLQATAPKMLELSRTVDDVAEENVKLNALKEKMELTKEEAAGNESLKGQMNVKDMLSSKFSNISPLQDD